MERYVLVPLDGSPLALSAIPHAIQLARAHAGVIALVRVITMPMITPSLAWPMQTMVNLEEWMEVERRNAGDYLGAMADKLRALGVAVRTSVLEGDPAIAILHAAEQTPAPCAIVMAS